MNPIPTSVSLLDRLKVARPDASDWNRLQGIYLPLIRRWTARVPGLGDEADDLAQDVFLVVVRELPRFERRREGSFRAWLRKVTVNQTRSHWRRRRRMPAVGLDPAVGFLDRLEAPDGDLAREWDRDHDRHVFERLLAIVQPDFQPDHLGSVPAIRDGRRPGGPGGGGTGADRERRPPGQVEDSQAVARRSRRPPEIIFPFRGRSGLRAAFLYWFG